MSDKPSFPGAEIFTKAMEAARHNAEEFTKMFADAKFPALPEPQAWMAAYTRNVEVLTQANKMAMEGAQAVAKRHMEIMQQTMTEMSDAMQALTASGAPQDKAAKQAELLKRSYERGLAHLREVSEMIQHTNTEAVGLLNKRFAEAMEEVKTLVAKA